MLKVAQKAHFCFVYFAKDDMILSKTLHIISVRLLTTSPTGQTVLHSEFILPPQVHADITKPSFCGIRTNVTVFQVGQFLQPI